MAHNNHASALCEVQQYKTNMDRVHERIMVSWCWMVQQRKQYIKMFSRYIGRCNADRVRSHSAIAGGGRREGDRLAYCSLTPCTSNVMLISLPSSRCKGTSHSSRSNEHRTIQWPRGRARCAMAIVPASSAGYPHHTVCCQALF